MERFNLMNYIRIALLPLHYTMCFKCEKKKGMFPRPTLRRSKLLLADIPDDGKAFDPIERLLANKSSVLV